MWYRGLIVAAVFACGSAALAQEKKTIDDQKVCPIMVDEEVNAESTVVDYQGIAIRLCCDVCAERFKEYPEAYLNEKYIPQLNGLKVPERKILQQFCPVYPDRVVTEKDLFVVYQGHKVYLFNKAAVKKWEKNPEKYAKAELLPQLALPPPPLDEQGDASESTEEASEADQGEGAKSETGNEGSGDSKGS